MKNKIISFTANQDGENIHYQGEVVNDAERESTISLTKVNFYPVDQGTEQRTRSHANIPWSMVSSEISVY